MTLALVALCLLGGIGFPVLRRSFTIERSITILSVAGVVTLLALDALAAFHIIDAKADPRPVADASSMIVARDDQLISVDGLQIPDDGYSADHPATAATSIARGQRLRIHGWALDSRTKLPGDAVAVVMPGLPLTAGAYQSDNRLDVAAMAGLRGAALSEFAIDVLTAPLAPGPHTFQIGVVAKDGIVLSARQFEVTIR